MFSIIFEWVKINREGFWQGLFIMFGFALLWALSKVVGRGKTIGSGILDTYTQMAEDLKKAIADERVEMQARLILMKEERDSATAAKDLAEDVAEKERAKQLALLTHLAAIREALAREGEVVDISPDGSVHILPINPLKDL